MVSVDIIVFVGENVVWFIFNVNMVKLVFMVLIVFIIMYNMKCV